jgi:serine/threonine-protein kinase
MNPDRWQRVTAIFDAALLREPTARAAYVAEACADDPSLRDDVQALLLGHERARGKAWSPGAPEPQRAALNAGDRLGAYVITGPLGAGGMGEVYRARDTRLGRDVAIKVLPQTFTADRERLARFDREARILASLNHPNIATIHGVEESDGVRAIVMELVEGNTLADRLVRRAVPLSDALPIARQIAEALDAAHEHGIVHRDLKPANIIITRDGLAKVLDFGLARVVAAVDESKRDSPSPTITRDGTHEAVVIGTAAYMSPEQARGLPVDKRTDIWAFGCVLYEMLTGRPAFARDTISDTVAAILDQEPDWSVLPDGVPAGVHHVLNRCLEKTAKLRLRDIGDALVDLFEPSVQRADAPVRQGVRLAVGLAGVAAVLAGLAAWALTRSSSPAPRLIRFAITLPPSDQLYSGGGGGGGISVALSPDGQTLVYVATRNSVRQLYRRALEQLEAVPIPGTEDAVNPFFSPDGAWLGFAAGGALKKVALAGGPPVTVWDGDRNATAGSWGDDDTIVFARQGYGNEILRVALGGAVEPVTTLWSDRFDTSHFWPELLPGGAALLFTVQPAGGDIGTQRIAVKSLKTGEQRILTEGSVPRYVPSGHVVFSRGNALWAAPFDRDRLEVRGEAVRVLEGLALDPSGRAGNFRVANDGTLVYAPQAAVARQLVWVSREGREEPLQMPPRAYVTPRLSPDGQRVAVDTLEPHGDLFLYNVAAGVDEQFTFHAAIDQWPIWSPDGSQVYFTSMRDGEPPQLYVKPVDGSGEEKRVPVGEIGGVGSGWSADGTTLIVAQTIAKRGIDIFTLRLDGRSAPQDLLTTNANEAVPVISPNGRWIAYRSDETGEPRIYVRPFPDVGRGPRPVSDGPGSDPLWRRDGRELFYFGPDAVMAVPVETGNTFKRGAPRLLFSLEPYYQAANINWDISLDGQRFLMVKRGSASNAASQLVVVQNWTEELKRLVPTK